MIKQCTIVFGCLLVGEVIVYLTGVKIPASILGMLCLSGLLFAKVIKIPQVKPLSDFLITNLAFFFVPPGVAIMLYFNLIGRQFIPIIISILVSTLLVMVVTGWVYQKFRKEDE